MTGPSTPETPPVPEKSPEGYSRDQFGQDLEAVLSSVLKPAKVAKRPGPSDTSASDPPPLG